jgi:putative ABC transport system permease protein
MLGLLGWLGVALIAGMLAITVHDALLRPAFRRLASRNLARRWPEGSLVVLGSSLGTAIIAASFLVGATFQSSLRDDARTKLGPIDEEVVAVGRVTPPASWHALVTPPIPGTDGVAAAVTAPAAFSAPARAGEATRAVPDAVVAETDFVKGRALGHHPAATGLAHAGRTPVGREVVINQVLASKLRARVGSSISLHAYGQTRALVVRTIVPQVGLAGAFDAFVAQGTIASMAAKSDIAAATPPSIVLMVSNKGGVFDSAGNTDQVVAEINRRLAGQANVEVLTVKQDLLRDATESGHQIGQLFTGVGVFSVLAGVLLLVNLFVMLAEERRRELGMARAVGLKRRDLMRVFALEGAVYAVLSAFVGALGGIAVGWLIVQATRRIFSRGGDEFTLHFSAPAVDLAIAGGIGLGIALLTVWITSGRTARMNVVRAIRDLPDPKVEGHRFHSSLFASVGVVVGGIVTVAGLLVPIAIAALVGPPIVLFSAIPLVRPVLGRRTTVSLLSASALLWCSGVFTFLPGATKGAGIPVFIVMGVIMVGAAVTLASSIDHAWVSLAERVSRTGHGLAARLGLAYPLARLFRTAMLLAMYSLIVFTLTFIAVYSQILGAQAHTFTDEVRAGTDLRVDSNPANPVNPAELRAQPGVAAVAPLVQSAPDFTASFAHTPKQWGLSGFDVRLLASGTPALSSRSAAYASDEAAFRSLLTDPTNIVVDAQFLSKGTGSQPGNDQVQVGDRTTAINPATGQTRVYTVVGIMSHDIAQVGSLASAASVESLMGDLAVTSRFYVQVDPGTSPTVVAAQLNAHLIDHGVDAQTFRALVDKSIATELGFLQLMQGYLALGLIIGIAGLGVVMVRAVRERRRQLGMLRAIGFSADTVRRAFLAEAAFIAAQGIVIGVALGLVTSYQMLTKSATLGGQPLPFDAPWLLLAALASVPFFASLAAVMIPASQAAAINPAAVLRRAD